MPYPALNSAFDALVPAGPAALLEGELRHASSPTTRSTRTCEHGPKVPAVNSTMHIYPINGACHRVAPDATAFAYRDANFATVIAGMWPDPADERGRTPPGSGTTTRRPRRTPSRAATSTSWPSDDQGRIRDNYKGNYDRLAEIKRRYDPGNLFRAQPEHRPGRCALNRVDVPVAAYPDGVTDAGGTGERSRDLERLLTFVDAVAAIAITLLVLPLVDLVPELHGDDSVAQLLREHQVDIGAFLLSFLVIWSLWSAQHRLMRTVVAQDRLVSRLLMLWTLTIVFLPFPTALVTRVGHEPLTKILYIGTMALSSAPWR